MRKDRVQLLFGLLLFILGLATCIATNSGDTVTLHYRDGFYSEELSTNDSFLLGLLILFIGVLVILSSGYFRKK